MKVGWTFSGTRRRPVGPSPPIHHQTTPEEWGCFVEEKRNTGKGCRLRTKRQRGRKLDTDPVGSRRHGRYGHRLGSGRGPVVDDDPETDPDRTPKEDRRWSPEEGRPQSPRDLGYPRVSPLTHPFVRSAEVTLVSVITAVHRVGIAGKLGVSTGRSFQCPYRGKMSTLLPPLPRYRDRLQAPDLSSTTPGGPEWEDVAVPRPHDRRLGPGNVSHWTLGEKNEDSSLRCDRPRDLQGEVCTDFVPRDSWE